MYVCMCVFAAFYDRSLRQESWYFIIILFHEYIFSFFPHSISSFLFNLIAVTHDWTCTGYTFSNGIMVIPRSYIFLFYSEVSVYLANLHISFNFWLFWKNILFFDGEYELRDNGIFNRFVFHICCGNVEKIWILFFEGMNYYYCCYCCNFYYRCKMKTINDEKNVS